MEHGNIFPLIYRREKILRWHCAPPSVEWSRRSGTMGTFGLPLDWVFLVFCWCCLSYDDGKEETLSSEELLCVAITKCDAGSAADKRLCMWCCTSSLILSSLSRLRLVWINWDRHFCQLRHGNGAVAVVLSTRSMLEDASLNCETVNAFYLLVYFKL